MLTQTAKESFTMTKYQQAKRIVREYFDAIENASYENVAEVLKSPYHRRLFMAWCLSIP